MPSLYFRLECIYKTSKERKMSIGIVIKGLILLIKFIPKASKLMEQLTESWINSEISDIETVIVSASLERKVLISKIQKCRSENERKILSTTLSRIS